MANPFFPSVPIAPGVPPLSRLPGFTGAVGTLLTADAVLNFITSVIPRWGVFHAGVPAIFPFPDTVMSIDIRKEWAIPDYPQEDGAFESYNKVVVPFETRVRLVKSGILATRALFLAAVDAIAGDLNFYDVVTPEASYLNVNVTHYDLARAATRGAGLIAVDIWLKQIRQTVTATFSNTANPNASSPISGGQQQPYPAAPVAPSAGQSNVLNSTPSLSNLQ